mmetsp:Transcript_57505/g.117695  ORF Transcript_57505/g.117695 Transcript_57505/m.117695 type:complete len:213 (-) Transcript_57505:431-1069(-)
MMIMCPAPSKTVILGCCGAKRGSSCCALDSLSRLSSLPCIRCTGCFTFLIMSSSIHSSALANALTAKIGLFLPISSWSVCSCWSALGWNALALNPFPSSFRMNVRLKNHSGSWRIGCPPLGTCFADERSMRAPTFSGSLAAMCTESTVPKLCPTTRFFPSGSAYFENNTSKSSLYSSVAYAAASRSFSVRPPPTASNATTRYRLCCKSCATG